MIDIPKIKRCNNCFYLSFINGFSLEIKETKEDIDEDIFMCDSCKVSDLPFIKITEINKNKKIDYYYACEHKIQIIIECLKLDIFACETPSAGSDYSYLSD